MKIVIPNSILSAASLFLSKTFAKPTSALLLELGPTESRLVASNGHILCCFRIQQETSLPTPMPFLLPPDLFSDRHPAFTTTALAIDTTTRQVTATCGSSTRTARTLHGTFPDYRCAIPHSVTGEVGQFDPRLLYIFSKAATIIAGPRGPQSLIHQHNGPTGPALIHLIDYPDFLGCIMPVRAPTDHAPLPLLVPDWVHTPLSH